MALHFKCEPIRSIKFLNPEWDSAVIFATRDAIYQADLLKFIEIIHKDDSADFGFKIPTKHHIKKIDINQHSVCLKMPVPSRTSENKISVETAK